MKRGRWALQWGIPLILPAVAAAQQTWVGPNLVANPGFEQTDDRGMPTDWTLSAQPAGCATFGVDTQVFLVGGSALRTDLPGQGSASLRSKPIPVEGGRRYLFSVAFRSTGFGPVGEFSGVDASVGIDWLDAAGNGLLRVPAVGFPYNASEWDLRDQFVQAPPQAAQAVITLGFSNRSQDVAHENIPSSLWLDAMQLRPYDPPPTPDWARQKVPRIVEGGVSTSRIQAYQLSRLNMAGGKWSTIVNDPGSTYGSSITSPDGVGPGIMAHSPYFAGTPPGLYRAVLRSKVADTARPEKVGAVDVGSELASGRAQLDLCPKDFPAANTYAEFGMDFILRTAGYWMFRVYTEGDQEFTADTVRVFPLALLEDRQLLDLYPGSEGAIPAGLKPKRGSPFTGLLVAGLTYDYFRIVDAFHLAGWDMKLDTVPVCKSRSQSFPGFPEMPAELFGHNVIYLCDVDVSGLTLRQKHMVAEYVRRGGGLIVFGGHKALDRGSMRGSLLEEVLPVTCREGLPPLLHFPEGAPLARSALHPLTEYTDFADGSVCFYLHDVQPRPNAQVLVTAGDRPAIVIGRVGQGRVACVAMACLGSPREGQTPFWQWSSWLLLLRDLSWWVAGEDEHFGT